VEGVAVPEIPLQQLQLLTDGGREVDGGLALWRGTQAFGHLGHHGDPHGDVKPVQQMLGLRIEGEG
jgi:hypothetical protein